MSDEPREPIQTCAFCNNGGVDINESQVLKPGTKMKHLEPEMCLQHARMVTRQSEFKYDGEDHVLAESWSIRRLASMPSDEIIDKAAHAIRTAMTEAQFRSHLRKESGDAEIKSFTYRDVAIIVLRALGYNVE